MPVIFPQDSQSIDRLSGVRNRRARSNLVDRITEHIGQNKGDQSPSLERSQQATALDLAEVFANRVEFDNISAGRAQETCNFKLVCQGDV